MSSIYQPNLLKAIPLTRMVGLSLIVSVLGYLPTMTDAQQYRAPNTGAPMPSVNPVSPQMAAPSTPQMTQMNKPKTEKPATPSSSPSATPSTTIQSLRNAKLYTWTDAKGVKHITDTPPPDILYNKDRRDASVVRLTDIDVKGKTNTQMVSEMEAKKKAEQEKQKQARLSAQEEATKKQVCNQLNNRINAYRSDREIRTIGENGQEVTVTGAARQEALRDMQEQKSLLCD